MTRPVSFIPFLTGEPVTAPPSVQSFTDLLRLLHLDRVADMGCLALGPGAILVHARSDETGGIALSWIALPHGPCWDDEPIEVALLLLAPVAESGAVLDLVSHLKACLADCATLERVRACTTRDELVAALAPVDRDAGACPLSSAEVVALLDSSPDGLSASEAALRREACGPNEIERIRQRPLILRFLEQFVGLFARLLWIGGAIAFVADMRELSIAIFLVIVVNGVFSFLQEYRAERAVEMLQRLLPQAVTVLRDGTETRVNVSELVPGDIVRLEEGDQVPADGQLLDAAGLRVDQSALTGEPDPVFKLPATGFQPTHLSVAERAELVFAGTGVMAGAGTCIVRATGMVTEIGAIARLTADVEEKPSPLQHEMGRVTRIVTMLSVSLGGIVFVLGVGLGPLSMTQGLVFALGVIVANVPEGLLPTLTLALALGVQRMAGNGSLVKRLSAVETLGATTVICTDKTGTLTENRMTARSVWVEGTVVDLAEASGQDADQAVHRVLVAAALASLATTERGDPTEVALVTAAAHRGIDVDRMRQEHRIVTPYPFDSFRKRMTLVCEGEDGTVAYVKGAPKELLALCREVRWGAATIPITEEHRHAILSAHDRLAADGLRLLAIATRHVPPGMAGAPVGDMERDLTFLGLVALWDPPRPEVAAAIASCQRAGIRVTMITGDYGLTAQAIARRIGLPVSRIVTGPEVERLSPEGLRALLREPGVIFTRTSPANKLAIVSALRATGAVVAVTGDGVNDAPALKAADIGVAMGKRGSAVAKEAAVMVITDDNFASIVAAVRQGRAIYANIGKFITYVFVSNVAELVPFVAAVLLGIPLPLTVMQILAVDLGTDLTPALALAAEAPEPGIMERPPRARNERLLGVRRLLHAYGFLGLIESALSLCAFFWVYWLAGWHPGLPLAASGAVYTRATTMTLAGIVAAQIGSAFACRTERASVLRVGLFSNRFLLLGIATEIAILLALIFVPPLAHIFGLARPRLAEAAILPLFPPILLGLEEARKWLVRRRRPTRRRPVRAVRP